MKIGLDVAQTCVERAGCAWYADNLSRALVKIGLPRGHTFELYHHFGEWVNNDVSRGTMIDAPGVQAPLRSMSPVAARAFWSDVAAGRPLPGAPDVVISFGFHAPKIPATKLVYTVHDLVFWLHPEFCTEETRLLCQRECLLALSRAAGFLFVSQHSRTDFEQILPGWFASSQRPWQLAPGASRLALERAVKPWSPDAPWLVVGSLEPRKNHALLLDAYEHYFQVARNRRPLLIAGGRGWKSEQLHARIAAMMARNLPVRYLGYVSDDRLNQLYADAFALIAPSWHEGFGLPLVEAFASGLPVLASERGSLPEVGGEAAEYFSPADPRQLAEKMLQWEASPEHYDFRGAASRARSAAFSWDRTANSVLEFVETL